MSGRIDVKNDALDGAQNAICVIAFIKDVPERAKRSILPEYTGDLPIRGLPNEGSKGLKSSEMSSKIFAMEVGEVGPEVVGGVGAGVF